LQLGEIVDDINMRFWGGVGITVLNGEPKYFYANQSTVWFTESLEGIPFGAFVFWPIFFKGFTAFASIYKHFSS